jgi:thymidine kinase
MLTVYTGPMFSGKTEALIRAVKRTRYAEQPTQVFVPASDTRNGIGVVRSHGGLDLESIGVSAWAVDPTDSVSLADRVRPGTKVVAIDEAQFFPASLIENVRTLLRRNLRLHVAGLDCDYRGEPFGPVPQLLAMADEIQKLTAVCAVCATDTARLTYRRSKETAQVLLGADDLYCPMCRVCYNTITQAE